MTPGLAGPGEPRRIPTTTPSPGLAPAIEPGMASSGQATSRAPLAPVSSSKDVGATEEGGSVSSFPSARPNESSAWIPAVRPQKGSA